MTFFINNLNERRPGPYEDESLWPLIVTPEIIERSVKSLSGKNAGSAGFLNLLLGESAEEFRLDDHGQLGQVTFAQDFEETLLANVDDGRLALDRSALIFRQEGDQL